MLHPVRTLMGAMPRLSPHRVFACHFARAEVYQPVPAPGGVSPAGPHTHVLPKLPSPASPVWRSRRQIREGLEDFFGIDDPRLQSEPIELWAWVGAYDHVALCQLWGPMTSLPPQIPRFTRELRQLWEDHGSPRMPARPDDTHDALVDARHNMRRYLLMTGGSPPAEDSRDAAGRS